jgi:hypothetical protein
MKIKVLAILLTVVVSGTVLSGCKAADVVGKAAVTSYEQLLNKVSDKVIFEEANNRWVLTTPTGEIFGTSVDFSTDKPDAVVEFDAEPFLKAGLNVEKLPSGQYIYDSSTGRITMPYEFGQTKFNYSGSPTALETFKNIVDNHRNIIGYHAELDHYGIDLGNGNMFEWAKDIAKNDKDIVFVLNPQPFIDAGVDTSKVEGWVFAKVNVKNMEGKMEAVDKLLKPFNLN